MSDNRQEHGKLTSGIRKLLRLRIWLGEKATPSELQIILLWAAVAGFLGAWASIFFKEGTDIIAKLLTGLPSGTIRYGMIFDALPDWRRIAVPVVGGLFAGIILFLGKRWKSSVRSSDYMEAIVVGGGNVSFKSSAIKICSALFSDASGASIGREGPLVQISSLLSSLLGRFFSFPMARHRQIVACGAAAGIASAYNAPIAGAFFVAEIILGSMAMEAFGPLVISSVVATIITRTHYGQSALYDASVIEFAPNQEVLLFLLLGIACGFIAPLYLKLLKGGHKFFRLLKLPLWIRLATGGLIVGILAVFRPEIAGNGQGLVISILNNPFSWKVLTIILLCKLLATAVTFGSGAVGGVFTPTLFTGTALGYLAGIGITAVFPQIHTNIGAFGLVGMGAFLAAATGAPVMAIIMVFELTLNYQILIPVMLAAVIAYYITRSLGEATLYHDALERKGAAMVAQHLEALKIGDLVSPSTSILPPTASFAEIVRKFIQNRFEFLHIADQGVFCGVVSLHDIKPYLDQPELSDIIIAQDILREDFPTLYPWQTMNEALDVFSQSRSERLPVTDASKKMLGVVSKTDVLLFLAGRPKR